MSSPDDRVIYEPRPDATPERQRRALAGLYRRVIEVNEARDRTPKDDPEDAERPEDSGPETM